MSARRDRAARGTARAALDGAALFALALAGDLPPLVKASESAAAFAHPWVAAALASRFRTAAALLEHRAARGPPPAWRLPALLAFAALDTQQDRDKCLDALARRATPLSDGDGVHVCEEHGGVTMKAAVVVDAAPDVADRRPFGPLSSHVVVKLSTAGVPKGSDAYRAAANAGAGKECEIPNFKGSDLGRFPLVSADFWTSDHLSERSRSMDAFSGTRARGTLKLKRT